MEINLSDLKAAVLSIFDISAIEESPDALMTCVLNNSFDKYSAFSEAVNNDLNTDHLQKVYQYSIADRKGKKQDFTPKCLCEFCSLLIGNSEETIDMCAGSGALSIQRWAENKDTDFEILELDENVIPFLLFNLAIRNINANVYQTDVLTGDVFCQYKVKKGEKFSEVSCIKSSV